MQEPSRLLRAYMDRNGLNQPQLANLAGVSQATVSRALRKNAKRRGVALARLFSYAQINAWIDDGKAEQAPERVIASLDRVWDRSDAHAEAIAKVIDALANFRPPSSE